MIGINRLLPRTACVGILFLAILLCWPDFKSPLALGQTAQPTTYPGNATRRSMSTRMAARTRPTTQQIAQMVAKAAAAQAAAAAMAHYQQLAGELQFMQDHLAAVQAGGQSAADVQSVQNVITDLQNQVQTAAAATQPGQ